MGAEGTSGGKEREAGQGSKEPSKKDVRKNKLKEEGKIEIKEIYIVTEIVFSLFLIFFIHSWSQSRLNRFFFFFM